VFHHAYSTGVERNKGFSMSVRKGRRDKQGSNWGGVAKKGKLEGTAEIAMHKTSIMSTLSELRTTPCRTAG